MLKKCDSWRNRQCQRAKRFDGFHFCTDNNFPEKVDRTLHSLPTLQRIALTAFLPMTAIKKF
jgi:hypothetical protein